MQKIWKKKLFFNQSKELIRQTVWLYSYVKQHWKAIIFYTLLGLLGTAVSLISSLISKNLVDMITGHETGALVRTFSLFIGFSIGNILITQLTNYVSGFIVLHVDTQVKADVFDKMLETDWEAISSYHTGDLMTRWSTDAAAISSGVLKWLPNFLIYTIKFISYFAVVAYYDITFAALALLGIPVGILLSRSVLRQIQENNKKAAASQAKIAGFQEETFANLRNIKAFDLLRAYSLRLRQYQQEYKEMRSRYLKMNMITAVLMSLTGVLISYSCYALGIYRVWTGAISYGTMTLFLSLANSLSSTLNELLALVPTALSITTSAGRLMEILELPKEDASQREQVGFFYQRYQELGFSVHLEDVVYGYSAAGKRENVLEHICFEAYPNEVVAVIGASGEGKTTLLGILLALLHPAQGKMWISAGKQRADCVQEQDKIIQLTPASRQLFSYVPQGNTVFSGTIAENLRMAKADASEEEMRQALEKACAWEFVSQLPEGIYSVVGERGKGLSEGQAQRIAIARALLHPAPVLLLDEATSALDAATEREVLRNIMADTFYPRTCIVTTHRAAVLSICSRVYEVADKQVRNLKKNQIQKSGRKIR